MNKETLKNAYQRFEEYDMILVAKSKEARIGPKVKLAPDWTPARDHRTSNIITSGRLWDFIERIAKSRREGSVLGHQRDCAVADMKLTVSSRKNRRDGATVATRVLSLAEKLGREMFADATRPSVREGADVPPKKRRRSSLQAKPRL